MTKLMDKIVRDVQELSQNEKNTLVKYLIASMDDAHDVDSDKEWADLSKKRFEEIESKKVQTLPWEQIKAQVLA